MPTIHPFTPDLSIQALVARRRPPHAAARRPRLQAIQAYAAPPTVAGTVVPATIAAMSAPAVQVNAAALLPHIEAWLAGPFAAPGLAVGCAISAGLVANMREHKPDQRGQMRHILRAAGQAGLGAPLLFGALQATLGPATAASVVARGVVFGLTTIVGAIAGHQAGRITAAQIPPPSPPHGKVFSDRERQQHHREHAAAAQRGSRLGGLAAGAIIGVATLRAF